MTGYLADDPKPKTSIPGASIISGIGYISGVRCFIWIDDSGINAGAITKMSVEKGLACIEIAKKHKLPLVHLVESAGVNLRNLYWWFLSIHHSDGYCRTSRYDC